MTRATSAVTVRDEHHARVPRRSFGLRTAFVASLALAPALLTYLLVHARFGVGVRAFVPNYWNDQVAYWHKAASFAKVGFAAGYYSPNEQLPVIHAVPYGVSGPWFPALYGTIGSISGWSSDTSILVNMGLLAVGFVVFALLAKLDLTMIALAGVALLACWPVLLYVPTASQESLHQSIAIVLAGVFARAIRLGSAISTPERIATLLFLASAALLRYSWAIVLPVLILLWAKKLSPPGFVVAVSSGVALLGVSLKVTSLLQPVGTNSGLDAFNELSTDPSRAVERIAQTTWDNLKAFSHPGALDPVALPVQAGVQDWLIVALCALALLSVLKTRGRVTRLVAVTGLTEREAAFHLVNLGVTTIAALILYIPFGYYRFLGAHLLLSLLVFVACRRPLVIALAVALSLAMLPAFLQSYDRWRPNFALDQAVVSRERAAFSRLIVYDSKASSPWCNTLLLPLPLFDWRVTLVPPGIGVSDESSKTVPNRPKSRYVLLDHPPPAGAAFRELGSFSAGTLYENGGSLCRRQ